MELCTSCGTENQKNSKFCQNCGSALEIQSSVIKITKKNDGESKATVLPASREERFRKAKLAALKAIKDTESESTKQRSQVVFVGEKIT